MAFSPDGRRIASLGFPGLSIAGQDGRIVRGFDAAESADLSGVELEWTSDGTQLVVGDTKGVVSVWNPDTGEHVRDIVTHPSPIVAIDVSPDGSMVASVSENVVQVHNAATSDSLYLPGLGRAERHLVQLPMAPASWRSTSGEPRS